MNGSKLLPTISIRINHNNYLIMENGVMKSANLKYGIIHATKNGDLETLKWLIYTFGLDQESVDDYDVLDNAILNNHVHICKWYDKKYDIKRSSYYDMIINAAIRGHTEMLDWLEQKSELKKEYIQDIYNDTLVYICNNGHNNVLKWFFGKKEIEKYKGDICTAFNKALLNNHLEVCITLSSVLLYSPHIKKISEDNSELYILLKNGYIEQCRWICGDCYVNLEKDKIDINKDLIPFLVGYEDLSILRWLHNQLNFTYEEICTQNNILFRMAAIKDIDTFMWLLETFVVKSHKPTDEFLRMIVNPKQKEKVKKYLVDNVQF